MFSQNTLEYEAMLITAEGDIHFCSNNNVSEAGWNEIEFDHFYVH
jgi:hypothetical protein